MGRFGGGVNGDLRPRPDCVSNSLSPRNSIINIVSSLYHRSMDFMSILSKYLRVQRGCKIDKSSLYTTIANTQT